MHAVVVRETGDPVAIEEGAAILTAAVIPRVRQSPGFVSATWLADGTGGTLNVLVFVDEAAATAALERVRTSGRPPYLSLQDASLYEVLASG